MVQHINFYEQLKEANMRLKDTIILYDGEPYLVLTITNHKADGKFRIYLDPLGGDGPESRIKEVPYHGYDDVEAVGPDMDKYLTKNPNSRIIRKMMNSPLFNGFKPFPLGMINWGGKVIFSERNPTRNMQQGLMSSMVNKQEVKLVKNSNPPPVNLSSNFIFSEEFYNTIIGEYPSAKKCLMELTDPDCLSLGAAFHREYAFMSGPVNSLFLAYKTAIVGQVNGLAEVILCKEAAHLVESVEDLEIFNKVTVGDL